MKYQLEQIIYYMRENKVHSAPVLAALEVKNAHQGWAHSKEQKEIFTPFGPAGVKYATCHGIVSENEAFASREELAGFLSLPNDAISQPDAKPTNT